MMSKLKNLKSFFINNTSTKQTVAKNTFWLVFSEASGRLLKMALVIYAARILGADGWGTFSYAISIGSILMIFSDIGLGNLITREIVQKKENFQSLISTALLIKIALLLIGVVLVIFVSPFISRIPEAAILFPIIAAILFFDAMRELGFSINRALEKMEREMIVKTIMSIVILGLGVMLLVINPVPKSMAISYAIGGAIGFVVIAIIIRNDIHGLFSKIDKDLIIPVLKIASPFAVIALVGSIMANTDVFMLGVWKNSTEIGWYASTQRIQQFILIIPSTISIAVFPAISRLADNEDQRFSSALERAIALVMLIGIPIALGGLLLAEQISLFVFGPEYAPAAQVLQVLMLMLLASFPLVLLSNAIFANNKQKDLVLAYLLGIIANVLLNFALIPKLGATGAALATLASTTVVTIIIWRKMKKINYFEVLPRLKKIFVATIIMAISILTLKYLAVGVILNTVISSLVYFVFLLLLKEPIIKEVGEVLRHNAKPDNQQI